MKRWYCPQCGSGKLAPERMREDNVLRYCLSCSETTGRLVRRWRAGSAQAAEDKQRDQDRADASTAARLERTENARKAKSVIYHQRGMCLSSKGIMVAHVCSKPAGHKGQHDHIQISWLPQFKKRFGIE